METICIKKSIFQALKLIVLSGAFVALGILILYSEGKNAIVGWINLVFFGSALLLGFYQLFDRRDQLIANEHTLFDRMNLNEPIAWSSVEKIELKKAGFIFSKQAFAMVTLKPLSGEALNSKIKKRIFAKKITAGKPFDFGIALTPLQGNSYEIFSKLAELKASASAQ